MTHAIIHRGNNDVMNTIFFVISLHCRTTLMLRNLGLNAIPLHGQMSQAKRLGALNKFKSKDKSILVSTDVASRGLDIPHVDVVINFDIPTHSKVLSNTCRCGLMLATYNIGLHSSCWEDCSCRSVRESHNICNTV